MLLSLLKILFFFAVVLAVSLGAMHLQQTGWTMGLTLNGVEYVLGPVQVLVALLSIALLGWLAFRLLGLVLAFLRFLAGDETAINRYFARSRARKGYEALGEGMLAVAAGEGKVAQAKAAKAEKYLDQPHVTRLLAAQAAECAGDTARATQVYRELLGHERTRFVGVRGLMRQKLAEGDTDKALKLAEKAYALKPRHHEVQDTLLQLQTQAGDWKGARGVLKDKRKQGQLPQDVHIRRDAVLALQEASEVLAQGNSISAREAAISANRASPDLIPAAVLAARSYLAKDDTRHASRVLEKTWSVRPHPDVAAAYAEIVPDETPQARLRRFERLIAKAPDHEESRLLKAELLLAAEDFPAARRALGDLASVHPTVRTLSIMAAIERGEGADDALVRGWLTRALTASRGPQWCCDKCQNVMAQWGPVCDKCGGFDTLSWREPDARAQAPAAGAGAEMLPLLVGAPGGADAASPADAAADITPRAPEPNAAPARAEARPGMVDHVAPGADAPAPAQPAPKAEAKAPNVAPGMVPRESDYEADPSATITTPDPAPEAAPAPAPKASPAPQASAKASAKNGATPAPAPQPEGARDPAAPHPVRSAEFDVPAKEAEYRGEAPRPLPGRHAPKPDPRNEGHDVVRSAEFDVPAKEAENRAAKSGK